MLELAHEFYAEFKILVAMKMQIESRADELKDKKDIDEFHRLMTDIRKLVKGL